MGNLLWTSDRPEFCERVAKLAGDTTYRVPTEGKGTKVAQVPDAHAIAAALAYARQGPQDIGPDVAYCLVLQSDAYRWKVCRMLAEAMGNCMDGREIRHARQHAMTAALAAWEAVIHLRGGVSRARPHDCPAVAWDKMLLTAIARLHDSAWDALAEAERKYYNAA